MSDDPTGELDALGGDDAELLLSDVDETGRAQADVVELLRDPTPVGEPLLIEPADEATTSRLARRSSMIVAAVVVAAGIVGAVVIGSADSTPPPKPDIPLDAWAPYWTLDDATEVADQRLGSMRDISPFWFNATGAADIEVDPNADPAATERFLEIARGSDAEIVPSIVDAMPAGGMASVLADDSTRSLHVDTLVEFAADGDYGGLDLDYERFAFSDGRDTWETTRPDWVSFVEQLADRLHADGRTLTVSIPPVYDDQRTGDSGYWVYDYGAIAQHVDRIRVMAYDFSVGEPGPIAPLEFVERSIDGALVATDAPEKIVLGLPAYGRNWPIGTTGECNGLELEGVTSVNNRTVDELIARRAAVPTFDEVTGEWSFEYDLAVDGSTCVQRRRVHYVDADGIRLRMDLARDRQLNGVSLWAFGFDDDDVWEQILPTVDQP